MTGDTRGSYQPAHISVSFTRLAPIHNQHWRENASCRGKNVNNWYPHATPGPGRKERQQPLEAGAKLVCRDCPVRLQCLHHAITTGERHGIHGGLNYDERRALERKAIDDNGVTYLVNHDYVRQEHVRSNRATWQEGHGPDVEGTVLDNAATAIFKAVIGD